MSFAGGLARGLVQGQQLAAAAEERRMREKMAKMQGQMLELQMKLRERQAAAGEELSRMMGEEQPIAGPPESAAGLGEDIGHVGGQDLLSILAGGQNTQLLLDSVGGDVSKLLGMRKTAGEMRQQDMLTKLMEGMTGGGQPGVAGGFAPTSPTQGQDPGDFVPPARPSAGLQFDRLTPEGPTFVMPRATRTVTVPQGTAVLDQRGNVLRVFPHGPDIRKVEVQNADGSKTVTFQNVAPKPGGVAPLPYQPPALAPGAAAAGADPLGSDIPMSEIAPGIPQLHGAGSPGGGGIRTAPSDQQRLDATPIALADNYVQFDPETGLVSRAAPGSMTNAEARANPNMFVADNATLSTIRAQQGALSTVEEIGRLSGQLFKAQPGLAGRAVEGVKKGAEQLLQSNPALTQYESARSGLLSTIARAFGEKGALAEGDVGRVKRLLPATRTWPLGLPDTAEVAERKVEMLDRLLKDRINTSVGKRIYDVVPPTDAEIAELSVAMDDISEAAGDVEQRVMGAAGEAASAVGEAADSAAEGAAAILNRLGGKFKLPAIPSN